MDIKRTVLWAIFFVSAIMLFDNWQRDHGRASMFFPNPTQTHTQTSSGASPGTAGTPGSEASVSSSAATPAVGTAPSQPQVAEREAPAPQAPARQPRDSVVATAPATQRPSAAGAISPPPPGGYKTMGELIRKAPFPINP